MITKGLVSKYGEGDYKMGGGQGSFEILPLHKEFGEGWKSFSQSEGGAQQVLG